MDLNLNGSQVLMNAEFVAFGGMDEDDARDRGFLLAELAPLQADDDEALGN